MDWQTQIRQELEDVIQSWVIERTEAWAAGSCPENAIAQRLTEDLSAEQYASWYEQEILRCDRQAWIAGTQQAARSSQGQGLLWSIS